MLSHTSVSNLLSKYKMCSYLKIVPYPHPEWTLSPPRVDFEWRGLNDGKMKKNEEKIVEKVLAPIKEIFVLIHNTMLLSIFTII